MSLKVNKDVKYLSEEVKKGSSVIDISRWGNRETTEEPPEDLNPAAGTGRETDVPDHCPIILRCYGIKETSVKDGSQLMTL